MNSLLVEITEVLPYNFLFRDLAKEGKRGGGGGGGGGNTFDVVRKTTNSFDL